MEAHRAARPDECWPWTKGLDGRGYGKFKFGGKHYGAHRLAYETTKGTIPDGLHIMHSCDNPLCCSPAHVSAGTPRDNVHDMIQKGRQKHTGTPGVPSVARKLTAAQVAEIRADHSVPATLLADRFGVSQVTISACRRGASYPEKPGERGYTRRPLSEEQRSFILTSTGMPQREIAVTAGCSQAAVSRVRDAWRRRVDDGH